MTSIAVRRATGAVLAAALAGAGLLAGATDAAASDALSINVAEYGMTLPRGLDAPAGTKVLHVGVAHDRSDLPAPPVTLTVDTSGLAGVADVTWPKQCTHAGAVGTCAIDHAAGTPGPGQESAYLKLGLTAAAGAHDGDHGTIAFTATAPGLRTVEDSTDVSVGSGADMTVDQLSPVTGAKVGSTLPARIAWSNTGNRTAESSVLTLTTVAGLDFTQRFSNCTYSKPADALKTVTAVCVFDTPLPPGSGLKLTSDLKLRVTSEAWYTFLDVQVLPPGEQNDATRAARSGTRGDGPRLTVTPVAAGRSAAHTADINERDSRTELEVHADNHAHFSAIGASVRGDKGDTVPVTVGMRNSGPALIFDRSGGEGVDHVKVTLPAGTTVTTVPAGCSLITAGTGGTGGTKGVKGHGPYTCFTQDGYIQPSGYQAVFTFKVRLDKQLTDARGAAALTDWDSEYLGKPVHFAWDTSTDGYTMPIVFNGPEPADGSQPGTAGGSGATNAPGPDGQAPALAATGGGGHAGLIAGGAGLVLAAGAGILLATRRRRGARG